MAKTKAEIKFSKDLEDRIKKGIEDARKGGDGNDLGLRDARTDALRYYERVYPARFHENSSSYVSSDVFDAVETRKATLLETFTGNVKPVRFAPSDPQFADMMEQATARVDQVVMEEQAGFLLFQGVLHDGLMGRNGLVQAYWEDESENVPYSYPGLTSQAATALISQKQDQVVSWDVEQNDDGTENLEMTLKVDKSGVRIESVPQEEFGINSDAATLDEATFTYRRRRMTLSRLKGLGVPSSIIDELIADKAWVGTSEDVSADYEKQARISDIGIYDPEPADDMLRKVEVFEAYLTLDTDAGKQTFQVLWAAQRLLTHKRVRRHPFHSFVPLLMPHRFWGLDFAGTVKQSQKVTTSLMRFALDHGMSAAVPRWMIREGALANPKEMENPVMGGLINIQGDTAGAILPLPAPQLNPALFKLMEQAATDKQQMTGSNDLSGSMLKDVISNQNSADLVTQMATMGQTRTKMMARNFAFFLKGLYEHVYDLLIENVSKQTAMQMGDQWVFVDPSVWPIDRQAHVEFHIGYGERDKEAAQLMQFDQYASAQPGLGRMYGESKRFNVLSDMMKLTGRYNIHRYLDDPASLPPPQPNPAEQAEAQLKEREMAIKEQTANTASMAANAKANIDAFTTQMKAQTNEGNQALKQQQQELKVASFQHQAATDAAEIALQHRAHDIHAIAKPVNTQPQR